MDVQINSAEKMLATPTNPIPIKERAASTNLIDLGSYYNHALNDDIHHKPSNTLSSLPTGVQNMGGVNFDVRGIIQLAGLNSVEITSLIYPETVNGIKVGVKGKSVHFIHASSWNIEAGEMQIGQFAINYENGSKEMISIIYKKNVWDWWGSPTEPESNPIWKGENNRTKDRDMYIRLYKLDWLNPYPELIIKSIDLISNSKGPGSFVVAITIQ